MKIFAVIRVNNENGNINLTNPDFLKDIINSQHQLLQYACFTFSFFETNQEAEGKLIQAAVNQKSMARSQMISLIAELEWDGERLNLKELKRLDNLKSSAVSSVASQYQLTYTPVWTEMPTIRLDNNTLQKLADIYGMKDFNPSEIEEDSEYNDLSHKLMGYSLGFMASASLSTLTIMLRSYLSPLFVLAAAELLYKTFTTGNEMISRADNIEKAHIKNNLFTPQKKQITPSESVNRNNSKSLASVAVLK